MESRDILEERELPEKKGVLASKRYTTTATGVVIRETRTPFCDSCGYKLDYSKPMVICCICGKKLCNAASCSIVYRGKHYCEEDLQNLLPLERLDFKIIHGLIYDMNLNEIKDLIHCRKETFKSALKELLNRSYVEKKGISVFTYFEVLDRGILAWKTYHQTFSKDEDIAYFIEEVQNHFEEESTNAIKRNDGSTR